MNTNHSSGEFSFCGNMRISSSSKLSPICVLHFFYSFPLFYVSIHISPVCFIIWCAIRVFCFSMIFYLLRFWVFGFFLGKMIEEKTGIWKGGKESVPDKNATHVAFQKCIAVCVYIITTITYYAASKFV